MITPNIPKSFTALLTSAAASSVLCIETLANAPNRAGFFATERASQSFASLAIFAASTGSDRPWGPGEVRDKSMYSTSWASICSTRATWISSSWAVCLWRCWMGFPEGLVEEGLKMEAMAAIQEMPEGLRTASSMAMVPLGAFLPSWPPLLGGLRDLPLM